jgi:hypothetical protein
MAPSISGGDEAPSRVGRFELITRLGAGGMANVYLARHQGAAGFERLAAIKLLHRHLSSDDQFVQMFFDEARVAARIHHPNVVPILDLGTERDQLYMVMDYVEGDTLAAVQRTAINLQRAVPVGIVLRIILDALAGLDNAHDLRGPDGDPLNVVHRDISPQNILVGVDGVARLVDFGIARAERRLALTSVGTLKGKAPFMAPEHLEGRPVDRRADVFSMAVTLWESLALRRLYPQRSDVETVTRANRVAYRPLSTMLPHLPPEVDVVCERALAFEADGRYSTAGEFADAIESVLREHIATHRQVAAFMGAVAADKVGRERNAIRNAPAARAPETTPVAKTKTRYDSGVQPLQRFNTPAVNAVPPPPAMPNLEGMPDLPEISSVGGGLPDLPNLDVATSVSHLTQSMAPVRGRPAVQALVHDDTPARVRPTMGVAQQRLMEPEPVSVRPGAGVQVVKARVPTQTGPSPVRPSPRATPPMGTSPGVLSASRRPVVEENTPVRRGGSKSTLNGLGEQGARPITAQDIEDAVRKLEADDDRRSTLPTPDPVSSVRRATHEGVARQATPARGNPAPPTAPARAPVVDDANEFALDRSQFAVPERPTLRAPGNATPPMGSSIAAPAMTKTGIQTPRASADATTRFVPQPPRAEQSAGHRAVVAAIVEPPALRDDPPPAVRNDLKLPSTFMAPPETSSAHLMGRAAAAVSVISAAGILWLIFR